MHKLQVYVDDETLGEIDRRRGLGTRSAFAKAMMQRGMDMQSGRSVEAPQVATPRKRMPQLRGAGGAR